MFMKIKDVTKTYKNKIALDNINIDIDTLGLTFILGESGSGKTTLLNLIGGIDKVSKGSILFDDIDITKLNDKELDEYRNKNIGFIFQEYNLIDELSVSENLSLILKMRGIKEKDKILNKYFNLVDLDYDEFKNKKVYECSGGERQRIVIIRALLKSPKIILCDEPTGALDSKTSKIILDILKNISRTKQVIIVSHDKELANEYGDRIISLEDGKIIKDEIINEQNKSNNELIIKRSKLPLKHMLKIGLNNYKKHPIRIGFIMLFLTFSMALFMVTLNFIFLNQKEMEYDYINNNEFEIVKVDKINYELNQNSSIFDGDIESLFIDDYLKKEEPILIDDYDYINNMINSLSLLFFEQGLTLFDEIKNSIYDLENYKTDENRNSPSGYAYANYDEFSELVDVIGRCPKEDNEILISDIYFNDFKKYGYKNPNNLEKIEINNYTDLIGKKIYLYDTLQGYILKEVVGIYNSNDIKFVYKDESTANYAFYKAVYVTDNSYINQRSNLNFNYHANCFLISPSNIDLKTIVDLNHNLINNKNSDKSYTQYLILDLNNGFDYIDDTFYAVTFFSNFLNTFGIMFLIISILLMFNTFNTFINKQEKKIGILKTLGVNRFSINSIYISIAIIEAIIVTILSSILSIFTIPILDDYIAEGSNINILKYHFSSSLIALLITILVIIISIIIPLIKLNKKTPIDIIKEGKAK